MAAGPITLIIKDSQGYPRQARFWSSDGTEGGFLSPIQQMDADQLAAITDGLAPIGTEETLAAILAKLITSPATSANQDTIIAGLGSIDGHVDGLEANAAAILAKISADPATQTTLAAVLTGVLAATPAGEAHIGEVGGNTVVATQTFNRPADTTPYATGDLVANNTTAGSVTPISLTVARKNGGTGRILRLRLSKSGTSLTNASFRVHLFRDSPTTSAGDNAAFSGAVNGLAKIYIGYIDITMDVAFSDGAYGFGAAPLGPCLSFAAAGGSQAIYALVEARAAYAGASGETFTLYAEVDRD